MNLGEKIYELRSAKNLSQGELADRLDVSRQSVSKWETGAAIPDLDKLINMCDVFGITLDELTGRTPQQKDDAKTVMVVKSASTPSNIVGYILLSTTLIASILLLVLNVDIFLISFPFLLSTLVCSIICLCVKSNIGYWCTWAALAPVCTISFYIIGLPFLSTTGGTQIIVYIVMTIVANKKFKGHTVQTSKSRSVLLALGFIVGVAIFVALIFIPLNWISMCIINYIIYYSLALLLTYSVCYIKTLRSK